MPGFPQDNRDGACVTVRASSGRTHTVAFLNISSTLCLPSANSPTGMEKARPSSHLFLFLLPLGLFYAHPAKSVP